MPASYFLGTRLLGSTIAYHKWDDATECRDSEALFCPTCGEVWGRVVEALATSWHCTIRPCHKHGPGLDSAGSFIAPWRNTTDELPSEVLLYEVQLRLQRN